MTDYDTLNEALHHARHGTGLSTADQQEAFAALARTLAEIARLRERIVVLETMVAASEELSKQWETYVASWRASIGEQP